MTKVFNIFAGGKEDKNSKIVKNLLSSQVPTTSRPSSAVNKRPASANYTGIPNKPQKGKAKIDKQEIEAYNHTSREDFLSEISELKRKIRNLEESSSFMKSENQRLENEATKQQRRIDQLMNLSEGAKNMPVSADIRKDIEKSILVRQLKVQINLLRNSLVEKDLELDTIRRNIKATHVSEVENERDEYFNETVRLSKILLELQDELLREKQRREWNSKLAGGTGEDLRKEVARLASGYQNILSNISTKMPSSAGVVRPQSSSGLGRSGRNHFVADVDQIAADNKPKRPQSAVAKTSLTNYLSSNNANTNAGDAYNSPPKQQLGRNFQVDDGEPMSPMFDDPLDNFNGTVDASTPLQQGGGVYGITTSSPFANMRDSQKLTTPGGGNMEALNSNSRPTSAQVRNSPYKVGEKVWGLFRGGSNWYNATVKAIHAGAQQGVADTFSFHVLYDDGDEEKVVPASRVRPLSHGNGLHPVIPLAPLISQMSVSGGSAVLSQVVPAQPVQVTMTTKPSQFKLHEKVEALYYKGTTYYPATVTLVTFVEADQSHCYDLRYDDGDREKRVAESSIRLKNSAVDKPSAAAPMGDSLPATEPVAASVSPVEVRRENEPQQQHTQLPAEDVPTPRSPAKASSPVTIQPQPVLPVLPQPKFAVGDKVQGYFQQYDQWFDGMVAGVNVANADVTYKILYDDGDREDSCAESRLREKPTPAAATSTNTASASLPISSSTDKSPEKPKPLSPVSKASPRSSSSSSGPKSETVLTVTKSKFKRGDKVECQFGGMSSYYPAAIENVRIDAQSSEKVYLYDLLYDDGDRESDVPEVKIRLLDGAVEKSLESRNKVTLAPVVSSASRAKAKVDDSDSDCSPAVSPRQKDSGAGFVPKFRVDDKVQGFIEQYSQWFDGTIVGVNVATSDYKVLYDDGDRDGHCAEANLRIRVAPTAPPVSSGNELDAFLNELSDDEGSLNGALDGGKFVANLNTAAVTTGSPGARNRDRGGSEGGADEYDEDFDA